MTLLRCSLCAEHSDEEVGRDPHHVRKCRQSGRRDLSRTPAALQTGLTAANRACDGRRMPAVALPTSCACRKFRIWRRWQWKPGPRGGASSWRACGSARARCWRRSPLVALIVMITWSNRARDAAIGWERRSAEITILTRNIDATIARSEAALGRYVLDEKRADRHRLLQRMALGRLADRPARAADPRRSGPGARVARAARALSAPRRRARPGRRPPPPASAAAAASACSTRPPPRRPCRRCARKLEEIAAAERANLDARMADDPGPRHPRRPAIPTGSAGSPC